MLHLAKKARLDHPVILVCPLNWGLGHATRMVPVINAFLSKGCKVIVGADGKPLQFLRQQYGDSVTFITFPGKVMKYSRGNRMWAKLILQAPGFVISTFQEHFRLKKVVNKYHPDLIISDNRYGAWSRKATSVLVYHQLFIRLPWMRMLEPLANRINHMVVKYFDICWVPDFEGEKNLSGELSHGFYSGKRVFIGPLSRFELHMSAIQTDFTYQLPDQFLLVLLSGPEPQRSKLESLLERVLQNYTVVWFRGIPGSDPKARLKGKHLWFDHAGDDLMRYCLEKCDLVICRSGYSTVMDLAVFAKKAVFIPTPGQTEQEYLAGLFDTQKLTVLLNQKDIALLPEVIDKAKRLSGMPVLVNGGILEQQVEVLLRNYQEQKIH